MNKKKEDGTDDSYFGMYKTMRILIPAAIVIGIFFAILQSLK